jgi:hypothetical protein
MLHECMPRAWHEACLTLSMIPKRVVLWCVAVLCLAACSGNTSSSEGSAGSVGNPSSGTGGLSAAGAGGKPLASTGTVGNPPAATGALSAGETGGTSGTSSPTDATNAQECRYTGGGGANGWSCDYVSIEFSEPLPKADLQIEVTTSGGDVFVPTTDGSSGLVNLQS